jgi:hypothetical protein
MKKLVLATLLVLSFSTLSLAGEKEELQWKARALIAEVNLFQSKVGDAQKAIQDFVKELDTKGYMVNQEGNVVEKPKAQTPPPPIPPIVPKEKK